MMSPFYEGTGVELFGRVCSVVVKGFQRGFGPGSFCVQQSMHDSGKKDLVFFALADSDVNQ